MIHTQIYSDQKRSAACMSSCQLVISTDMFTDGVGAWALSPAAQSVSFAFTSSLLSELGPSSGRSALRCTKRWSQASFAFCHPLTLTSHHLFLYFTNWDSCLCWIPWLVQVTAIQPQSRLTRLYIVQLPAAYHSMSVGHLISPTCTASSSTWPLVGHRHPSQNHMFISLTYHPPLPPIGHSNLRQTQMLPLVVFVQWYLPTVIIWTTRLMLRCRGHLHLFRLISYLVDSWKALRGQDCSALS